MLHLRWMIRSDVPSVLGLDECQTEERLLKQLAQRDCIGMVIEDQNNNDEIVGYMVYRLYHEGIEVVNLAGDCECFRLMVSKLKEKLFANSHRTEFTFNARSDDFETLHMLKDAGMIAIDIFHGEEYDVYRFIFQKEWELCASL